MVGRQRLLSATKYIFINGTGRACARAGSECCVTDLVNDSPVDFVLRNSLPYERHKLLAAGIVIRRISDLLQFAERCWMMLVRSGCFHSFLELSTTNGVCKVHSLVLTANDIASQR